MEKEDFWTTWCSYSIYQQGLTNQTKFFFVHQDKIANFEIFMIMT